MEQDILLKEKFSKVLPFLNEKQRRLYLGSEALYIGRGGVAKVSSLTGVSRITINSGVSDLLSTNQENIDTSSQKRVRQKGGGRKKKSELDGDIKKNNIRNCKSTHNGQSDESARLDKQKFKKDF